MGVLDPEFTGKLAPGASQGNGVNGIYSHGPGELITPSAIQQSMNDIYADPTLYQENWYKQRPYGFIFTNRKGESSTFYLPIAPSNINIVTHFATNVISTMYGTVEEHTEQRYFDITISGTTGMSPRYFDTVESQTDNIQGRNKREVVGRAPFPVKTLISGELGGFAKRTQSLISSSLNNAADIFGGEERGSTGIDLSRTGYIAFHNFYRWLLNYKKDVSGEVGGSRRRTHPLQFVNFKDNNIYDVAVQNFQLTRNAEDPMLYNYTLTMRAYNLRSADTVDVPLDVQDRAADLGLDGVETSFFSKMANKAAQAKKAAYGAIAAVRGFGA